MKLSVPPEWGAAAPAAPDAVRRALWFPDDRAAFAQEPIFVPRRGGLSEDDGWVLTLVYSASCHRTSLVRAAVRGVATANCAGVSMTMLHACIPAVDSTAAARRGLSGSARCRQVILDAQSMQQVAAVRLQHHLPYGVPPCSNSCVLSLKASANAIPVSRNTFAVLCRLAR